MPTFMIGGGPRPPNRLSAPSPRSWPWLARSARSGTHVSFRSNEVRRERPHDEPFGEGDAELARRTARRGFRCSCRNSGCVEPRRHDVAARRLRTGSDGRRALRACARSTPRRRSRTTAAVVVDEVVADPLGPPGIARSASYRRRPLLNAASKIARLAPAWSGWRSSQYGSAIVCGRWRRMSATSRPDERRRRRHAAVRPAEVLAPGRAEHAPGRLGLPRRPAGVPLLPSSPAVRSHRPTMRPPPRAVRSSRPVRSRGRRDADRTPGGAPRQ